MHGPRHRDNACSVTRWNLAHSSYATTTARWSPCMCGAHNWRAHLDLALSVAVGVLRVSPHGRVTVPWQVSGRHSSPERHRRLGQQQLARPKGVQWQSGQVRAKCCEAVLLASPISGAETLKLQDCGCDRVSTWQLGDQSARGCSSHGSQGRIWPVNTNWFRVRYLMT